MLHISAGKAAWLDDNGLLRWRKKELLLLSNHSEALISPSTRIMGGIFCGLSGGGGGGRGGDLTASLLLPPLSHPSGFDLFFTARLSHLSRAEWLVK